jgi:(2Fe-2S) ferredoxin/predicted O-methyltransferase YrrM
MEPFKYHVFICNQQKPEGVPCCTSKGAANVIDAIRAGLAAADLQDDVQITLCGSLGLCENGPNMIVYPDGTWYGGLTVADVPEIIRSHFQEGKVVERLARTDPVALRGEILINRGKMLASMRAKEVSGILPDDLMQTIRSFQESRVLLSAIELDIFTAIGPGAGSAVVAERLGTDFRATEMFLNALAAMGLLNKDGGVFRNTAIGERYLVAGSRNDARAALTHTAHLWSRWSSLTDCVRAGTAAEYQEMEERGTSWTEAFIAAMDRNAAERVPWVVSNLGIEGVRRVLDVGGGSGAYSIAFAQANPGLQAEVFDLAEVTSIAQGKIDKAGLAGRIKTRVGDLSQDPLGNDYDLVFVSQICHMLDPAQNLDLFSRSYAALTSGGRVAIQDFILEADKTSPKSAALFSLNMLVGTSAGSSYSVDEYIDWLQRAGFSNIKHIRLPGPSGLIVGTRI